MLEEVTDVSKENIASIFSAGYGDDPFFGNVGTREDDDPQSRRLKHSDTKMSHDIP